MTLLKDGQLDDGLGEAMHIAYKSGDDLPEAVEEEEFDQSDREEATQIKRFINEMTAYNPGNRPSTEDVLLKVTALHRSLRKQVTLLP